MARKVPAARRVRRRPHRVVMLAFRDAQILDVSGPLEVFARTSRWLRDHRGERRPAYEIELVAEKAGPVRTSGGLTLVAQGGYHDAGRADTLLIAGGIGYEALLHDEPLLAWMRERARRTPRMGSICTGAMLLAAAGLLEGRHATTHWAYCDKLRRLTPKARIDNDALYVRSGRLYTSAGVTAGMDMALAMVEEDWGRQTALAVAQELVMFLKRPGGQSQFSRHLEAQVRDDRFGRLELWILEHLDADLSVEQLAARAHLSPRHFAREFTANVGATPAAFVARLRVEQARRSIEDGTAQLKEVARRCGFRDEQRLRRAFRRMLGVTPQEYRARFAA